MLSPKATPACPQVLHPNGIRTTLANVVGQRNRVPTHKKVNHGKATNIATGRHHFRNSFCPPRLSGFCLFLSQDSRRISQRPLRDRRKFGEFLDFAQLFVLRQIPSSQSGSCASGSRPLPVRPIPGLVSLYLIVFVLQCPENFMVSNLDFLAFMLFHCPEYYYVGSVEERAALG
jgi:hypothetical protein